MFNKNKNIYLDYASATPLNKEVSNLMSHLQRDLYANASAIHREGVKARKVIDDSRTFIAKSIFAHSDEIIFTGSGTESDALAILGTITNYELLITNENTKKILPHIVTTAIEHPAVLENCRTLEKEGRAEVTYIKCDANGIINPKDIKSALKVNTILVSVMYANNEIGTIQPIAEIAKEIRHFRKGKIKFMPDVDLYPLFHTDACQAMNYLPTENVEKLGVDLLSFNSSKIYGPKGVGILYKKRGVTLAPMYTGGGQESGLRSGTENTVAIAGASFALGQILKIKEKENERLIKIRDYGIEKLLELSESSGYEIKLNGDAINRLPNNINISISGISSELLVIELDARGVFVSAKSACKADEPDESYVITSLREAQGVNTKSTEGSLRITLGRGTTKQDMSTLVTNLKQILSTYKKWK
ncbi:cysteine desulfurase [Candidatus Nomurabacteria bacterium]|nr:cysteine desulfurase [Candidatus Nomurabacteria bacterium]